MSRIEHTIKNNRARGQRNIMAYINAGDPMLAITEQLIRLSADNGIDIIELGVPFPNSFTDGATVRASHQRALQNNINLDSVITLVRDVRKECDIPIVLLADFSHSVKPAGIASVVHQCADAGIDGLLLHGLPPLFTPELVHHTQVLGIDPIFSLYPATPENKTDEVFERAKGFIYLVSQYGKTGSAVDFTSPELSRFYRNAKQQAPCPVLAGFGIRGRQDIETIFNHHDVDGVILGSALCKVIESSPQSPEAILQNAETLLKDIQQAKTIQPHPQPSARTACEHSA